jgi:hypothetical protein
MEMDREWLIAELMRTVQGLDRFFAEVAVDEYLAPCIDEDVDSGLETQHYEGCVDMAACPSAEDEVAGGPSSGG